MGLKLCQRAIIKKSATYVIIVSSQLCLKLYCKAELFPFRQNHEPESEAANKRTFSKTFLVQSE